MWDFFAWVGVTTLTVIALKAVHFAVGSILVMRVGWDRLGELGFWRATCASFRRRDNGGAPAGFG